MVHPYFDVATPIILGHRGAAGDAPENTLPSFERALEVGAHMLESDIHGTRDDVPVLCHDPAVDRTTEASGLIQELDLAALQMLDAGYRFQPEGDDAHPFRGRGIQIPTLREAFEAFPDARFNLEIKADRAQLVAEIVTLVAEFDRAERTLLTAGSDSVMALLRAELARQEVSPALGASTADVLTFVRAALDGSAPQTDSMALQIPVEFAGQPLITKELISHAHAHGVHVHAWTINDETEMTTLLDLGVDGLVTDYPERMAKLLERATK